MMPNAILNDVIQVIPGHELEGCFLIVTKVSEDGVEGLLETYKWGRTKINLYHDQYEKIAQAPFIFYQGDNTYGTS